MHCKYAPVSCNEGGKVGSEQGGRRDSLHSVARRRRRRRKARGREGGAVGGSDKTGDMGPGGRHLHCELLAMQE